MGGKILRNEIPNYDCFGKVVIEDDAYIGAGALIMPGCVIGKNSLVAAGSVVTKSVPPFTVVGGNPAHVICTVDEYKKRNLQYNTGTKGMNEIQKKNILLSLPEEKFVSK